MRCREIVLTIIKQTLIGQVYAPSSGLLKVTLTQSFITRGVIESSSHKLADTEQQQTEGTQEDSEGHTDPIFSRVPT